MRRKISLLIGTGILMLVMLACSMPLGSNDSTETPTATVETGTSATNTPGAGVEATATFTAPAPTATHTNAPTPTQTSIPTPCNWAKFISDVTYADGDDVDAGASFTKTWRLQNIGSCTWTSDYRLVFFSGDKMGAADAVKFTSGSVAPNDAVNVSIELTAPNDGGTYKGYFKLRAPDGTVFGIGDNAGGAFWVEIESIEEEASSIPELSRNLKLTNPYMQGSDVKTLQKRLLDLGYDVVEKADGIFGPKTDKGVREFQDDEGLTVDGVVGPKTWKALWE